jgi:transcriptional regulator with XRE-family HTH domain
VHLITRIIFITFSAMSQEPSERGRRDPDDTVARVLNDLFATHRHPEGREWMNKEVAQYINSTHAHLLRGSRVDPSHISKMRSGEIRDPGRRTLLAICAFFGVSPTVFFPELAPADPLTGATAQEQLRVALRATGLSPQVLSSVEGLIRSLQQSQATGSDRLTRPDDAPADSNQPSDPAEPS